MPQPCIAFFLTNSDVSKADPTNLQHGYYASTLVFLDIPDIPETLPVSSSWPNRSQAQQIESWSY